MTTTLTTKQVLEPVDGLALHVLADVRVEVSVTKILLCPRISLTILGWTPHANRRVAVLCRRS
ncbi:MAG: hypothetical protein ACRDZO_12880 [Egibacteraceae bacterium]